VGVPQGKAILYSAIKEGLVDNNPYIGDGYVTRILNDPPMAEVRDSAFEQLVIGGKLYLPFWIPNDWEGAIFEAGLVESLPRIKEKDKVLVESLSDSTILHLLRERGHNYSLVDLKQCRDEFMQKYKEWEEISNNLDYNVVYSLYNLAKIQSPSMYTEQQYNKSVELINAHEKVEPIEEIFDEYSSIITHAMNINAYSSLSIETTNVSNISLLPAKDIHQEQALLQISCNELNAAPIGYSLKQTIQISKSAETAAYRSKLDEWVTSLKRVETDDYHKIHDEINYCLKQLRFSRFLNRTGNFLTYIGVPMSILGMFNPAICISGLVLSIVGGIGLGTEKYINAANKWAMFGLKNIT
jgi:hypothetical protein